MGEESRIVPGRVRWLLSIWLAFPVYLLRHIRFYDFSLFFLLLLVLLLFFKRFIVSRANFILGRMGDGTGEESIREKIRTERRDFDDAGL